MGLRHGPGSQHMMGYSNYGLFWIVITGVLLLIILFLVYKLIQRNKQSPREFEIANKALHILKERYARGELTDEEFTRKKEVLDNNK
ncbi:SHOCT domain-containing protein [Sporosarcina sp. FA9]|uniref:SHOCT domain-containing protein n=1 Tax=Sporosarcina sp. FA9 TaxID=3413030 RepID=UPI003F65603F